MRAYYASKSPEERHRIFIAGRDPERVRESDRKKMAKRRASGSPDQKLRIAARNEVRKAKLRGDIEPGRCEVCGVEKTHAHHDDYTKPLDIRWLCREHHDQLHETTSLTN
jgi:hypothetical protein